MATEQQSSDAAADGAVAPGTESLTVTDNRTGKTYELPISRRHRARRWTCARSRSTRTNSG